MTPFTKYEVQIYTRGAWKIESIFDDREIAIYAAKRIHGGGRYLGVRVVEERSAPAQSGMETRVIYRAAKTDESPASNQRNTKAAQQEARLALRSMRGTAGENDFDYDPDETEPARDSCTGAVILVLVLGALILGGIVAIMAIRHYFGAL